MKTYKYEKYNYDFLGIPKYLKVEWTPEIARDINAYFNTEAERELTSILSGQIAREIDREIAEYLKNGLKFDYSYEIKR
jgi:hypothetical protein